MEPEESLTASSQLKYFVLPLSTHFSLKPYLLAIRFLFRRSLAKVVCCGDVETFFVSGSSSVVFGEVI
ncbi:hypothetical protein HanRHA438_Chr02g0063131 [Helianthus annuus]|nr:hypothetical protein HanRHA438_Chr02g0063131 [Helianthus annuus]